jgi:tetratricopeptide (TPR) repeat protein
MLNINDDLLSLKPENLQEGIKQAYALAQTSKGKPIQCPWVNIADVPWEKISVQKPLNEEAHITYIPTNGSPMIIPYNDEKGIKTLQNEIEKNKIKRENFFKLPKQVQSAIDSGDLAKAQEYLQQASNKWKSPDGQAAWEAMNCEEQAQWLHQQASLLKQAKCPDMAEKCEKLEKLISVDPILYSDKLQALAQTASQNGQNDQAKEFLEQAQLQLVSSAAGRSILSMSNEELALWYDQQIYLCEQVEETDKAEMYRVLRQEIQVDPIQYTTKLFTFARTAIGTEHHKWAEKLLGQANDSIKSIPSKQNAYKDLLRDKYYDLKNQLEQAKNIQTS